MYPDSRCRPALAAKSSSGRRLAAARRRKARAAVTLAWAIFRSMFSASTRCTKSFKISFKSLYGIPLTSLNGYHTIKDVNKRGYSVELPYNVCLADCDKLCGGGSDIYISRVNIVKCGYSNPNNYTIDLQNLFHNVIAVNLVSSEIPNTKKLIRKGKNNKLYWNNINDGDYLYSIEIDEGNYIQEELVSEINRQFNNSMRISAVNEIHKNILGLNYTSNHCISAKLNSNTGEITFTSYKEYMLANPIVSVSEMGNMVKLTINHPNHNIINSCEIIVKNADDFKEIGSDLINGKHIIAEIIDNNSYIITLNKNTYNSKKKILIII